MNQKSGLPQIQRVRCMDCTEFACTRVCNYEALRISGKEYTVEELMEVIRRDRVFWQGNGGVTFGGGDPLVRVGIPGKGARRVQKAPDPHGD